MKSDVYSEQVIFHFLIMCLEYGFENCICLLRLQSQIIEFLTTPESWVT